MSKLRGRRIVYRAVTWTVVGLGAVATALLAAYGGALLTLAALRNWWVNDDDDDESGNDQ